MRLLNKHKATPDEIQRAIYIGRGAPLGNPYVIGVHGTRDEVISMYRPYLAYKLIQRDPAIENAFRALSPDSLLLCFCDPKPCHGEVVADFYNELHTGRSYDEALALFETNHRDEIRVAAHLHQSLSELETDRRQTAPDAEDRRGPDPITYIPTEDGVTHINVWSKGSTELGRLCSNLAHTPFIHPVYGHFSSVEGFWYWLSTGSQYNELRSLHGFESKKAGQILRDKAKEAAALSPDAPAPFPVVPDFEAQIKKAILCKVEQNVVLQNLLRESTLPLAHYYVWGTQPNVKVTVPSKFAWTYQYLEALRRWLNGKAYKLIIAGSRPIDSDELIEKHYRTAGLEAIEIVSGCARGVDTNGEHLAVKLNLPIARFPADWKKYDKAAGMIRNVEMAVYADAGLLFWDGSSKGTQSMEGELIKRAKPCIKITAIGAAAIP